MWLQVTSRGGDVLAEGSDVQECPARYDLFVALDEDCDGRLGGESCGHSWGVLVWEMRGMFGIRLGYQMKKSGDFPQILHMYMYIHHHPSISCVCTAMVKTEVNCPCWWIVIHPFIGIYVPIRRIPMILGRWPYRRYHVLSMTDVIIWIDVYIIYNFIYNIHRSDQQCLLCEDDPRWHFSNLLNITSLASLGSSCGKITVAASQRCPLLRQWNRMFRCCIHSWILLSSLVPPSLE